MGQDRNLVTIILVCCLAVVSIVALILGVVSLTQARGSEQQAMNIYTGSSSSASGGSVADTTIPVASNFRVTNTQPSDHVFTIGWDLPDESSYDYFEVSYTPAVGYPASPVRVSKYATSLIVMNALADTVYDFSLVSVRGAESSDPPLTASGQIVVNSLIIVIGARTASSLEILWGEQQAVDEYQVWYDGSNPITISGSDMRRVVIPNLSAGTQYAVTVRAIVAGQEVGSDTETVSTLNARNTLSAMVTDQTSSSIHLDVTPPFEDPSGYDGYNVRVTLNSVSSPVLQHPSLDKSACPQLWIRNLEPNTMYDIDIEWYSGLDISESYRITTSTVAAAPLDIGIDQVGTTSMTVSWQEGTGSFSNYLVTYSPGGSTPVLIPRGENRVLELTNLTPGTAYTIVVQQQGQAPASETHVQYTLPESVQTLVSTPSKNMIDLTWSPPSEGNFDGYSICHYPRGTQSSPLNLGTTPSNSLQGLNRLSVYLVSVFSRVGQLYSAPSTLTEQTLFATPGDINIVLEDVGTTTVRITWVVLDSITRYTVGRGTQASGTVTVTSSDEAEFIFTGLVPGTQYTFFVEPQGHARRTRQQYTKPSMPLNLIFTAVTTHSISFTWERPIAGSLDSYRVTYSPSSQGTPISPYTLSDNGLLSQSLTVSGLQSRTEYTFNVYALVADLTSEPVSRSSGTTISMSVGGDYTSTQFTIIWDTLEAGDFNQYYISYDPYDPTNPNAQQSPRIISVSSLAQAGQGSLLIYGLEPGELYNVYLETRLNGVQTDDGIGRITFRTPPLPLTDVTVTQRTDNTLVLDWSDVSSVDVQYRIVYEPLEGALFASTTSDVPLQSNQVSSSQIVARFLAPGKEYVFTIYPVSGTPNTFEQVGVPQTVVTYTLENANPVITCPAGFSEFTAFGSTGKTVSWNAATASDDSGEVTIYPDRSSPSFLPIGETVISYTAVDPTGKIATCSFTITIIEEDIFW